VTRFLVNVVAIIIAVYVAEQILPPGSFRDQAGLQGVVVFAVVLGLLNAIVRPIVKVLTCPFYVVTLGLFSLVVNAVMFWLAAQLTHSVEVSNFLIAFVAALIVSVVNLVLGLVFG
jgi:putative membrane protein